jgi:hypothetical protein
MGRRALGGHGRAGATRRDRPRSMPETLQWPEIQTSISARDQPNDSDGRMASALAQPLTTHQDAARWPAPPRRPSGTRR